MTETDLPFRVRLKPYNEKRGNLTRRHMLTVLDEKNQPKDLRFEEERGWYAVSEHYADQLRGLTRDDDPDLPELFDVYTTAEALKIERAEKIQAQPRMEVEAPASLEESARPGRAARRPTGGKIDVDAPVTLDGKDETDDETDEDDAGMLPVGTVEGSSAKVEKGVEEITTPKPRARTR